MTDEQKGPSVMVDQLCQETAIEVVAEWTKERLLKGWSAPWTSALANDFQAMFDAGVAAERKRACVWRILGDDYYGTACRKRHLGESDIFCPYCGGKIVVKGDE